MISQLAMFKFSAQFMSQCSQDKELDDINVTNRVSWQINFCRLVKSGHDKIDMHNGYAAFMLGVLLLLGWFRMNGNPKV